MRLLHHATLAGLFVIPFFANAISGLTFSHKDWELTCDNTGTCRAAGYGDNVSALLTRRAGIFPDTRIEVTFAQREQGQSPISTAVLFINNQKQSALIPVSDGYFLLGSDIRSAFIRALQQNGVIEFEADGERKMLSLAGSDAVLLKMDAFQKRINTESALLKPGPDNSFEALPESPTPLIATRPVISSPKITQLTEIQLQNIQSQLQLTPEMNCSGTAEGGDNRYYAIPIDKSHTLIQTACFDISRYAMWLTNSTLTASPQLITNDASGYEDGEIIKFAEPIQIWRWTGKTFALTDEYRSGGRGTLSVKGVWTLPTFVSHVRAQQDIDKDNAALKSLRDAINKEKAINPELNLKKVSDQFPLMGQATDFSVQSINEQDNPLPDQKPSAEISDDEWQAFKQSPVEGVSENGRIDYVLVDLDGDGKRDLIIDCYVGGTGLFSYTGVLKRGDKTFYAVKSSDDENLDIAGALFSESGRGTNQWSQWVRIHGQVYALWYNGQFGEDNLYLLRPFINTDKVPVVTIRYHYALEIMKAHSKELPAISEKDRKGLLKALARMQDHLIKDMPSNQPPAAICPIPPNTSAADADNYRFGEPLHYFFEKVAVTPVWLNNKCYIGTVASHHGYYQNGVDAEIIINSPRQEDSFIPGFLLTGKRHVTAIQSGWKPREGDMGVM